MAVLTEEGKWLSKLTGDEFDDFREAQIEDMKFLLAAIEHVVATKTNPCGLIFQLEFACKRLTHLIQKEEYEKHKGTLVELGTLKVGERFYVSSIQDLVPRTITKIDSLTDVVYDNINDSLYWSPLTLVETYVE